METVSAADSERAQRRVAGVLRRRGVREGDRVVLQGPPSGALLASVLGAQRSAVVPVVLDPALAGDERDAIVQDAQPALVVDDAHGLVELAEGPPGELADVPLVRPMHYTSGTTGRRKGVWSGTLSERDAEASCGEERELWGFDTGDRHLVLSPLHHSAPLRFATHTLLAGGSVVLPGPFSVGTALRAVREQRPTTVFCVPTHLQRILAAPDVDGQAPPLLRCFRLVAHAGAPCPEALKRRALGAFPTGSVWEFYGSTEAQFTVCSAREWQERPGTVGRARPGRALRTDDRGVIWCRLPRHARFSYWRDPGKTARAWRGDELSVGDLGRLDEDGYLFLQGRREDLVVTGGVNVYPAEVERVLVECPGVEEVAVFGVEDPRWGQRVVAAVVGDARPDVLRRWAAERLAGYQRPKDYHLLPALPRTSTGKVRRLDLPGLLGRVDSS